MSAPEVNSRRGSAPERIRTDDREVDVLSTAHIDAASSTDGYLKDPASLGRTQTAGDFR
jgi:hypothetical protein